MIQASKFIGTGLATTSFIGDDVWDLVIVVTTDIDIKSEPINKPKL